jgi:hypothetical protein
MTDDKALKRAIRARMDKTGERYIAARRHTAGPNNAAGEDGSLRLSRRPEPCPCLLHGEGPVESHGCRTA